ncbi:cyclase family protein [Demequina sp.]|uniref:cyclase family protein n=1 Tax=Demequina sp. TaxID=2050685 RepID=UPI003D1184F3
MYRAHLDFHISFANGGHLDGEGFRLDVPRRDVSREEVAALLVRHLGLAVVGSVDFSHFTIVEEAHKGSRGVEAARPAGRTVVDLSHPIRAGLVTYPGLPVPIIEPFLTREASSDRYAPGTEFAMDVITLIGNTGTYLDSPWHRYVDGADLAGLALSTLVGLRAEVFHLSDAWGPERRGIGALAFADRDVRGAAVLIHTGWDRHFGSPAYATGAPFLAADAVHALIDSGAALVGIDSLNIDDTESGGERPAHSGLLAAGIHVVEHLTRLGDVPAQGAEFTAAPPAVEGFGTFPVRAFALVTP